MTRVILCLMALLICAISFAANLSDVRAFAPKYAAAGYFSVSESAAIIAAIDNNEVVYVVVPPEVSGTNIWYCPRHRKVEVACADYETPKSRGAWIICDHVFFQSCANLFITTWRPPCPPAPQVRIVESGTLSPIQTSVPVRSAPVITPTAKYLFVPVTANATATIQLPAQPQPQPLWGYYLTQPGNAPRYLGLRLPTEDRSINTAYIVAMWPVCNSCHRAHNPNNPTCPPIGSPEDPLNPGYPIDPNGPPPPGGGL